VIAALDIGSNLVADQVFHTRWEESKAEFDLVTISESGRVERGVLKLGIRIVVCERPDHPEATIHWARTTNIWGFDQGQVKNWLSMCENGHKDRCGLSSAKVGRCLRSLELQEFRLVDVQNDCIVKSAGKSRYLALSYVWGDVEGLKLQKHSCSSLADPGSLRKYRDRIPKAICDAMKLVDLVGERYLWVDSLCLVQDDHQTMVDGINSMNFIFENALATIVAAEGSDASVGLRRLHSKSPSSTQRVHTIKQGLSLTAIGACDVHVKKSKWSSRAWT
jgi:Heterokaryon incompatibility protein (HET)